MAEPAIQVDGLCFEYPGTRNVLCTMFPSPLRREP